MPKYVTKVILAMETRQGTPSHEVEEVIMSHDNMDEVLSYVRYNNLVFGEPKPNTPYFSVRHDDGSSLSDDEMKLIMSEASTERYGERIKEAIKPDFKEQPPDFLIDPESGLRHSTISNKMHKK